MICGLLKYLFLMKRDFGNNFYKMSIFNIHGNFRLIFQLLNVFKKIPYTKYKVFILHNILYLKFL